MCTLTSWLRVMHITMEQYRSYIAAKSSNCAKVTGAVLGQDRLDLSNDWHENAAPVLRRKSFNWTQMAFGILKQYYILEQIADSCLLT